MTPELQNLLNQAQQNVAASQRFVQFIGYTTFFAILICAIFSVLIFWKLCQIQKHLAVTAHPMNPGIPVNPFADLAARTAHPAPPPVDDDDRFRPKK